MNELTEGAVRKALNEAADLVIDEADLPDTGARDAINLVVNLVGHWLFTDPEASLQQVIEANYNETTGTVLGWCGE